ncbi:MAG: class I SAM-dependent methyltransferase [Betaproteobacteria bacterium]|nr:MAG: class I SAM-dependent methyltransferase [Betaproteobacteria bacterium]
MLTLLDREYRYGKGAFRTMFPGLRMYRCACCGLKQIDHDAICSDALFKFYADAYRAPTAKKNRADPQNVKFVARANAFAAIAARYVEQPAEVVSVLELGAGLGYNLIGLKRIFPNANMFTDEPDSTVELPRGVAFAGLEELAYDVVLLSHVLEHFLHPADICRRISAALRPGGTLIVEVPNDADVFLNQKPEDQPHLIFFETQTLLAFFERHFPDFDILHVATAGRAAGVAGLKGRLPDVQPSRSRLLNAVPLLRVLYAPVRHFRICQAIRRETDLLLTEAQDGSRMQLRLIARKH